jgi:phosphoribosylformylglycinamidine synthase PurS subunit
MMRYGVEVTVLPKDGVLDTQGKAVERTLRQGGYAAMDVRVGRSIRLVVEAESEEAASAMVDRMSDDLLANNLIESYAYKLEPLK